MGAWSSTNPLHRFYSGSLRQGFASSHGIAAWNEPRSIGVFLSYGVSRPGE